MVKHLSAQSKDAGGHFSENAGSHLSHGLSASAFSMGHSAIGLQATQAFKNNANLALNKVKSSLGDTLTPRFGAPTFPKVGDANPIPCTNTCTDARVEHWPLQDCGLLVLGCGRGEASAIRLH